MDLSLQRRSKASFDEVREAITESLAKEGFGILTLIDLEAKFQEKLGKSDGRHLVLGACNPALAWDATQAVPEIAVMLPCNVVLRQDGEEVVVDAMNPQAALGLIDNPAIARVAEDAYQRLERAMLAVP